MDYSTAVGEIWRHHDLSNAARDYVSLVRYATLAASSHNTQPWKFKPEPGRPGPLSLREREGDALTMIYISDRPE